MSDSRDHIKNAVPQPAPLPSQPTASAPDQFARLHAELRAIAQNHMNRERPGHTLTATALVHEVFLKLGHHSPRAGDASAGINSSHSAFFASAARAMRQLLVDHARAKLAQKRGGPGEDHAAAPRRSRGTLLDAQEVADLAAAADPDEILSLDAAISRLESEDPQAAGVVRLRFFAGLSIEHTALVLGISPATVKRDWQFARAWLYRALSPEG